ncbi:tripartite tricarboxylate transporter permease [Mesorhizobium sp. ASY16-5R]|uniref:tripartite tricarboxylate transporter permease n=1 Tax=Mesorhizobium sp. ASY16-5R TaxID=3445772 RepID=UPI003FA031B6
MELLSHLALGASVAFTLQNLFYAFVGCLLGTLIGILPGLGPLATIAILLPFTYGLDPTAALIMLAGIYYGSQYGGSTTAILLNLPGETSSVVTVIDGHKMAQDGRAGTALATAAISSFVAGCVGTLILAAFAIPLTRVALSFGPAEYFSLLMLGLVGAVVLTPSSLILSLCMLVVGVLLGMIGTDVSSGVTRFTFGISDLWDGIDFVVVAVGMFAAAEIVANLTHAEGPKSITSKVSNLWPTRAEFRRMTPSMFRGTALGSLVGILPGAGAALASFMAYTLERKFSRHADELGHGALEGVAGPEAANNAAAQTAFIPTLTLGIPGTGSMAMLLGAMMIHNIQPGPQVMTQNPDLFWGLIVSMWIGNLMLVILNLPLIGLWVRLLKVPYKILFPAILMFCCVGVYSVQSSTFDVVLVVVFGFVGYIFRKLECDPLPLMLGFVLGPMLEEHFRRAMILSKGDLMFFFERPVSAVMLSLAVIMLLLVGSSFIRKQRREKLSVEA